MEIKELKVGQTVYIKRVNNEARYLDSQNAPLEEYISEAKVTKVGRLYFYVGGRYDRIKFGKGHHDFLFDISDYCERFQVYLSKQDIFNEKQHNNLLQRIREEFGSYRDTSFTLSQLRRINHILEEKNDS